MKRVVMTSIALLLLSSLVVAAPGWRITRPPVVGPATGPDNDTFAEVSFLDVGDDDTKVGADLRVRPNHNGWIGAQYYAEAENSQRDEEAFPLDGQGKSAAPPERYQPFGGPDEPQAQAEPSRHRRGRHDRSKADPKGPLRE